MSASPFKKFSVIPVDEYTTPCPVVIDIGESVYNAISMMAKHDIRHLPVVDNQRVIGILSDRDTRVADGAAYAKQLRVSDVMQDAPYHIEKNTPLLEVVFHLSEEKIGSAIVTDNGKLDGIFTTTDALNALVDMLKSADEDGLYIFGR